MQKRMIQVSGVSLILLLLLGLVGTTLAQGTEITMGTAVQGVINATASSAAYTFTANAGDVIQADGLALTPEMQLNLVLIGPNQAQLAAAGPDITLMSGNQTTLLYATQTTGSYMLMVSAANNTEGSFILSVNQFPTQAAQPLTLNEPAPITLSPDMPGLVTEFTLDPGSQTIVNFEAEADMVYSAIITSDQGEVIASLNSGARLARFTFDPGLAVYYSVILVSDGNTTGTITVSYGRSTAPITQPTEESSAAEPIATAMPAIVTATPAAEVTPSDSADSEGSEDSQTSETIVNAEDCTNAARFMSDTTIADGMLIEPNIPFVKSWRVANTGTCTWTEEYSILKVLGDGIIIAEDEPVALPVVQPGETADISVTLSLLPNVPLGERSSAAFEISDESGFLFGPNLTVEVTSNLPETSQGAVTGDCLNQAAFVADVTILDGTAVTPGESFVKTWRVQNTGTCPWTEEYKLAQLTGDLLLVDAVPVVPPTEPGETAELSVTLTLSTDAPADQEQQANFRLQTPDEQYFGEEVYLKVVPE